MHNTFRRRASIDTTASYALYWILLHQGTLCLNNPVQYILTTVTISIELLS